MVDWCLKTEILFVHPDNRVWTGNHSAGRARYDIDKLPFVLEFIFEKMSELEKQLETTTETVKRQQKSLDLLLEKMLEDSCDVVFATESVPCVAQYMFDGPN